MGPILEEKGTRCMAEAAQQTPFCLMLAHFACSPAGAAAGEEGQLPLAHAAWGRNAELLVRAVSGPPRRPGPIHEQNVECDALWRASSPHPCRGGA